MTISYRSATTADAAPLVGLFRQCFCDTFGHLYKPDDLATFLAEHTDDHWRQQLADPNFAVLVAEDGGRFAGFAKLGPLKLPVEPSGKALELRQLYVLGPWHGSGMSTILMDWVVEEARRRGAADLYLSVFTENHRARRFYARYAFKEVGPYRFMVGSHADEDIIMRARL